MYFGGKAIVIVSFGCTFKQNLLNMHRLVAIKWIGMVIFILMMWNHNFSFGSTKSKMLAGAIVNRKMTADLQESMGKVDKSNTNNDHCLSIWIPSHTEKVTAVVIATSCEISSLKNWKSTATTFMK